MFGIWWNLIPANIFNRTKLFFSPEPSTICSTYIFELELVTLRITKAKQFDLQLKLTKLCVADVDLDLFQINPIDGHVN